MDKRWVQRLEVSAKVIGAVAALLVAVVGVAKLVTPSTSTTSDNSPTRFKKLFWGPTDCGTERAVIGIDGCSERRELEWLRGQLKLLRNSRVKGFVDLPGNIDLEPGAYKGNKNWILHVRGSDRDVYVGVGYDPDHDMKDGALRLAERLPGQPAPRVVSAVVRLDESEDWWVQDSTHWRNLSED